MTFLVAVLVGWFASRALAPIDHLPRPRWLPLLFIAAGAQVGISMLGAGLRDYLVDPGLVVTNAAVGVFFVVNAVRPGLLRTAFLVATAGWAMNAAVVATNGAMPVSADAMARAGFAADIDVADGFLYEHEAETEATRLRPLGDVIPIPAGPLKQVISPGDIVLAVGIAMAASHLFRTRLDDVATSPTREEVT